MSFSLFKKDAPCTQELTTEELVENISEIEQLEDYVYLSSGSNIDWLGMWNYQ